MLEVRRDWKRICRMLRVGWIVRVDWSVLRKGFLVGSSIFFFFFFGEEDFERRRKIWNRFN